LTPRPTVSSVKPPAGGVAGGTNVVRLAVAPISAPACSSPMAASWSTVRPSAATPRLTSQARFP
jgi:hypothetical protein